VISFGNRTVIQQMTQLSQETSQATQPSAQREEMGNLTPLAVGTTSLAIASPLAELVVGPSARAWAAVFLKNADEGVAFPQKVGLNPLSASPLAAVSFDPSAFKNQVEHAEVLAQMAA
jgi:hypothetical protein